MVGGGGGLGPHNQDIKRQNNISKKGVLFQVDNSEFIDLCVCQSEAAALNFNLIQNLL